LSTAVNGRDTAVAYEEAAGPDALAGEDGTTGSGDCTIAGFHAGLLRGLPPEDAMTAAVAVGACYCEVPDATTGVRPLGRGAETDSVRWKRRRTTP
jgi:sugar/nucleoside kinase (ribokinase family)